MARTKRSYRSAEPSDPHVARLATMGKVGIVEEATQPLNGTNAEAAIEQAWSAFGDRAPHPAGGNATFTPRDITAFFGMCPSIKYLLAIFVLYAELGWP
uniref:Uncharacterized protein n=1 Tax=Cannabis sativa TaxID=3483 RepID=A0A803NPT4_CANSA